MSRWLPRIAIALFALSLVAFDPTCLDTYNLPKLWTLSAALLVGLLASNPRSSGPSWFVFLAVMALGVVTSADPLQSLVGGYYAAWETGVLALMCWLAYELGAGTEVEADGFFVLAGTLGAAYLVLQSIGIDPVSAPLVGRNQPVGAMGNPAWSAALCAMVFPLALRLAKCKDMVWVACLPVLIGGIGLSGSRGAMVATAAGVLWCATRFLSKTKAAIALGVVVVAVVVFVGNHAASDLARIEQQRIALSAWLSHPWLGCGPASGVIWWLAYRTKESLEATGGINYVQVHSHNILVNILATQGIVGLVAWSGLVYAGWKSASFATKGVMVCVGTFGLVQPIPHAAYAVLALLVGLDCRGKFAPAHWSKKAFTATAAAAVCLLFSTQMSADRHARAGYVSESPAVASLEFAKASDIAPWEPYYSARAASSSMQSGSAQIIEQSKRVALRSLFMHRGNPLAFTGATKALQADGNAMAAISLASVAKRTDPLGRMWEMR